MECTVHVVNLITGHGPVRDYLAHMKPADEPSCSTLVQIPTGTSKLSDLAGFMRLFDKFDTDLTKNCLGALNVMGDNT